MRRQPPESKGTKQMTILAKEQYSRQRGTECPIALRHGCSYCVCTRARKLLWLGKRQTDQEGDLEITKEVAEYIMWGCVSHSKDFGFYHRRDGGKEFLSNGVTGCVHLTEITLGIVLKRLKEAREEVGKLVKGDD